MHHVEHLSFDGYGDVLTSSTGKVWTEPAARVFKGRAACKMDRTPEIFQAPGRAVCVSGVEGMGGVKRVPHTAVVQNHVGSLHSLAVPSSLQGLIEPFKLEAPLAVSQDVTRYPAASTGTGLLCSHGYVVQHVVNGAKEWRNLKTIRQRVTKPPWFVSLSSQFKSKGLTCSGGVLLRIS